MVLLRGRGARRGLAKGSQVTEIHGGHHLLKVPLPDQSYQLELGDLAIFIDEAGDTKLADPSNAFFVLGGAIILGQDADLIAKKWALVRQAITGSPSGAVHMREHSAKIRGELETTLLTFFNYADMARLAVSFEQDGAFDLRKGGSGIVLRAVFHEFLHQQGKIGTPIKVSSFKVIFEESPLLGKISELCKSLTVECGDDKEVPVEFIHLSKKAEDPSLEIADVIVHTACGSIRTGRREPYFERRVEAIFNPTNRAPGLLRSLKGNFKNGMSGTGGANRLGNCD